MAGQLGPHFQLFSIDLGLLRDLMRINNIRNRLVHCRRCPKVPQTSSADPAASYLISPFKSTKI